MRCPPPSEITDRDVTWHNPDDPHGCTHSGKVIPPPGHATATASCSWLPKAWAIDRAGRHATARLKVPANVTLVHLPSKSTDLNPIEKLWHYLRTHHRSNRRLRMAKPA
jgi:hypothetical protein